ncbi:MAG: 30S ribosomal protein S17 [Candidatus Heimdallarchaeota archaeon]|nr:MAG: 30S ribosomal protein S17 [Candidatus Heimdallarchaeota archaeon]
MVKKKYSRHIGIAPTPKRTCDDQNCPFHGTLSVRGRIIETEVISDRMDKTVTVQRPDLELIRKYKRYGRSTIRMHAHNPPCIEAKVGDRIRIGECRPLSKTVSFVVIENLGKGE